MSNKIAIIVNGLPETVPENISVADLITCFKEGDTDLIVEHNGRFVYPSQYLTTTVSGGDRIEFINPNFGG
jgi:thiamine biosynthesis protein ThiS